jgi:hypothetical protein
MLFYSTPKNATSPNFLVPLQSYLTSNDTNDENSIFFALCEL